MTISDCGTGIETKPTEPKALINIYKYININLFS